jgi:hypothetical protein
MQPRVQEMVPGGIASEVCMLHFCVVELALVSHIPVWLHWPVHSPELMNMHATG